MNHKLSVKSNATTTTQKQSDYKGEQSSLMLIALFSFEIGRCRGRGNHAQTFILLFVAEGLGHSLIKVTGESNTKIFTQSGTTVKNATYSGHKISCLAPQSGHDTRIW